MKRRALHAKATRHYRRWQENIVLASPFVIFCGIIACVFLLYRFLLIAAPIASISNTVASRGAAGVVCGEEEGSDLPDPKSLLSTHYQARIRDQTNLSVNLISNPNVSKIDAVSGQPVGYIRTIKRSDVTYSRGHDTLSQISYLRVTADTDTSSDAIPPAWLTKPIAIHPKHTYAYSFTYRSNSPVDVSAEYTTGNKTDYKEVMTLQPSRSWQRFTAHFTNFQAATSFRMDISSSKRGSVDTRNFDIHEIASSELEKGIISIAFDDGWQSIADKAEPLLKKYQIRTTQYIIADVAAHNVPGYMSYATIQQLHQEGHEIGSHTMRHCDQTLTDTAHITDNATESKRVLEDKKLGPIMSFAYPLGQYNAKTQGVYKKVFPFIRSSDFGYNDRYFDETDIHSIGITNMTTDKQFQAWIDYAKKHKLWVVFVYHKVDDEGRYNTTSAQLNRQLQMIRKSGLEITPVGETAQHIR